MKVPTEINNDALYHPDIAAQAKKHRTQKESVTLSLHLCFPTQFSTNTYSSWATF